MSDDATDLPGLRFDHIAVAARSIPDLLPLYADALGGRFLYGGDNDRVGYRAVTLGFADGTKTELMEPLTGSSFLDRFFARFPLGGIHHVTMHTDDLDDVLERLHRGGFPVTGLYRGDPTYQEVFVHPKQAHGTLVQIVQTDHEYTRRAGTIDEVLQGR